MDGDDRGDEDGGSDCGDGAFGVSDIRFKGDGGGDLGDASTSVVTNETTVVVVVTAVTVPRRR